MFVSLRLQVRQEMSGVLLQHLCSKIHHRNDEYDLLLIVIDKDTDRLMESNAKLLDFEQKGFTNYLYLLGYTLVYVMSIYMVSIRFHQSVSAETKKLSSEVYSNNKHKLYMKMTKHI